MYHDELDGTGTNAHWQIDDHLAAVTWAAPTLTASWVNYGGAYTNAAYCKDGHGFVHLRGVIRNGTVSAGATNACFTLPVGYRPPANLILSTISNDAIGRLDVHTDGTAYVTVGNNTYVALSGVSFYAG